MKRQEATEATEETEVTKKRQVAITASQCLSTSLEMVPTISHYTTAQYSYLDCYSTTLNLRPQTSNLELTIDN